MFSALEGVMPRRRQSIRFLISGIFVSVLAASFYLPDDIDPTVAKMSDRAVTWHLAFFAFGIISILVLPFTYRLFVRTVSNPTAIICWLLCLGSMLFMTGYMFLVGTAARGFLD